MSILRNDPLERNGSGATNEHDHTPPPQAWSRTIPGEEATTPALVYEASLRLVQAGLSVIPIDAYEGSKSPDSFRLPHPHDPVTGKPRSSWSVFKIRRPTLDELRRWSDMNGSYGLAVLGGAVSGGQYGVGLEVIDIDTADLAGPWMDLVELKAPGLVSRLVRVRTPRPGLHVYYRCAVFGVSQKLAIAAAKDDFGHAASDPSGRPTKKTLIEVKAEGGYCLIPPSPPRCHPTSRPYRYDDGSADLTEVPTITPEERTILLEAARSLNQWQDSRPEQRRSKSAAKTDHLSRPGDDFNARADWADILTDHGWAVAYQYGDQTRWCRPGKPGGVSATTNHQGSDLLHVFSSNASPFEADRSYSKFSAYALLNHDGDFNAAAEDLRKQGYGKKTLKAGKQRTA